MQLLVTLEVHLIEIMRLGTAIVASIALPMLAQKRVADASAFTSRSKTDFFPIHYTRHSGKVAFAFNIEERKHAISSNNSKQVSSWERPFALAMTKDAEEKDYVSPMRQRQ